MAKHPGHTERLEPSEQTLAARVRSLEPEWSWSKCREVIASGRVQVNGKTILDAASRVANDAVIQISEKRHTAKKALPALQVYFYDAQVMVVEKPSGIESVPFTTKHQDDHKKSSKSKSEVTLIDLARQWLEAKEKTKLPPLRTVHRIDKGTSGIVVFARTQSAERHLNQLFRAHDIRRHYVAIVHGVPRSKTIHSVLIDDRGDGYRGSRPSTGPRKLKPGKEATTHVKVAESTPDGEYAMVECRLETGRTHQIRIHLSESAHPLCGDNVYRTPAPHGQTIKDESGAKRLMLHAAELGFQHPVTEEFVHFSSPLPAEFVEFWSRLMAD